MSPAPHPGRTAQPGRTPRVTLYRGGMGRTWVLRTETKGTGAQMVPIESVKRRSSAAEPVFVKRQPMQRPERQEPEPRPPRRFKVVDVMTRQTLADDANAREAVDALKSVRSIVDVNVYSWQEQRARWRLLSFAEQGALWQLARP